MNKIYILMVVILSIASSTFGQVSTNLDDSPVKRCATDEVIANMRSLNPQMESTSQFENWIQQKIAAKKSNPFTRQVTPQVTIPVVFHIIYSTGEAVGTGKNLPQEAVRQQIIQINKDFANQSNSKYAVAEDMGIRFALAEKDPTGITLAEPGIDRINGTTRFGSSAPYTVGYASSSNLLTNTIKPATIWNPEKYLNVWVSEWEAGILGIATFPTSSGLSGLSAGENNSTAGVAIGYSTVGSIFAPTGGCAAAYGKGKTLTHELGHFFGLRHIWGDSNCGTDYCNDTPTHFGSNGGEPVHPKPNSCGTADEMFENYMDYSDDIITNTFTVNQGDRIEAVMANSPRRRLLGSSDAGNILVTASNRIAFADCDGALRISEKSVLTSCPKYTDYNILINVEDVATGAATLTINTGGTAVSGVDYQLLTPTVSFANGDGFKPISVRILDNAVYSANKTLTLTYTISGTGVTTNTTGQSLTITIVNDDYNANIDNTNTSVTILNENFGTVTGSNQLPTGWSVVNGVTSSLNTWVVNSTTQGSLFSGNSAHISNGNATAIAAGTASNTYTTSSNTDARLYTPNFNTVGLKDISISFDYLSRGEADYDFGLLYYSIDGTSFSVVTDQYANVKYFQGQTTITNFTAKLPASASGITTLRFLFRWISDDGGGNSPAFTVDNIVIKGNRQSIESTLNAEGLYNIQSGQDIYLNSAADSQLIARLQNVNENLNCVTAKITSAGTALSTLTSTGGVYQRSNKVVSITPAVANTSATYQATFYYTTAEMAAWSANVPNLKILKVKDGVDLSSTLNASNSTLFTPTIDDQRATNGYVSYTINATGGFSQFLLVSPLTALPVLNLDFTAKAAQTNIILNWSTSSEINNKGFAIERSTDGIKFDRIDWVNGAGSTNGETRYSYIDNFVQPNIIYYYRLAQTDNNNTINRSDIKQAIIQGSDIRVMVSPNPATDYLKVFVTGTEGLFNIQLFNAQGAEVRNWSKLNLTSPNNLNISGVAKGVYMLNIQTANRKFVQKIIIQ